MMNIEEAATPPFDTRAQGEDGEWTLLFAPHIQSRPHTPLHTGVSRSGTMNFGHVKSKPDRSSICAGGKQREHDSLVRTTFMRSRDIMFREFRSPQEGWR